MTRHSTASSGVARLKCDARPRTAWATMITISTTMEATTVQAMAARAPSAPASPRSTTATLPSRTAIDSANRSGLTAGWTPSIGVAEVASQPRQASAATA